MPNYTNRQTTFTSVKKLENGVLLREDGWSYCPPMDVYENLSVGDSIAVETVQMTRVVGIQNANGDWLFRKSDEDLVEEDRLFREGLEARNRQRLEEKRANWRMRTYALPPNIRARIDYFKEQGGEKFEIEGWGYELGIAELAALLVKTGRTDNAEPHGVKFEASEEVDKYIQEMELSGNQVDLARALANVLVQQPSISLAGTVSGLSPITGSPYYN